MAFVYFEIQSTFRVGFDLQIFFYSSKKLNKMYKQAEQKQQLYPASIGGRALIGGIIGLVIVTLFLIGAGFKGRPEWHHTWFVRPLAVECLAGMVGGAISAWLDQLAIQNRLSRLGMGIFSLVIFIVGIWMGFVLGFVGTYWH